MRTPLRLASGALALGLALSLAGCGHEDDKATDEAAGSSETSTAAATPTPSSDAATYPAFAPTNYVYRLEVLCFCPQVGAVRVTVKDGEVLSAKAISANSGGKGGGIAKGADAPEFMRLTINDIIDRANDPQIDKAEVTWPDGQDYPSSVRLDQLSGATDDEVSYTIRNVRVLQISGE